MDQLTLSANEIRRVYAQNRRLKRMVLILIIGGTAQWLAMVFESALPF